MKHQLSEVWIKASIAGTIWAAAEVVLGSFLHNLRVPFAGNILTSIGMVILISLSYTWHDRGLFWRAGLICALMKTLSPSAVIFGPMIAIFMESLLLEFFTRILGKTIGGYLMGAMVAMSWNLLQKIVNLIIFYGQNIIDVYTNLLNLTQEQLGIQTDIVWLPVIILLVINVLFGLVAAIAGIRAGRKMIRQPAAGNGDLLKTPAPETIQKQQQQFPFSVVWLVINILLLILSFMLLATTNWVFWVPIITAAVVIWSVRYKRAFRQLSKPKFWALFVFITLLTAFVFTKTGPGENTLGEGLMAGIRMNYRAALMITGFAVLGTELYNPVIRNFFFRTSFRNLPLALELSAESLPFLVASIPDFKTLTRDPVSVFYRFLAYAEGRLSEIRKRNVKSRQAYIITGGVGEGKTTFVKNLVLNLREQRIPVAGILLERLMSGSQTTGYDLIDIETGNKAVFLRKDEALSTEKIGRFSICPEGEVSGNKILNALVNRGQFVVVVDEVGLLELQDHGWSKNLQNLVKNSGKPLIMTVREDFVREVVRKWDLNGAVIFHVAEKGALKQEELTRMLLDSP